MTTTEQVINRIIQNIEKRGLKRYDPQDLWDICPNYHRYVSYFWRSLGYFFPILVRKIFGRKPHTRPTTYTHLAEALLLAEQNSIRLSENMNSIKICEDGLKEYLVDDGKKISWPYKWLKKYPYWNLGVIRNKLDNAEPTMMLHYLTRYNILLLKLGLYYDKKEYISIAHRTAIETMKNHQTCEYSDGSWSISYTYHTADCTLNVNTEFAQWLSMIPESLQNNDFRKALNGIVKLILREQNDDGSWHYYSKDFYKNLHTNNWIMNCIDCEHTGMVLTHLVYILKSPCLERSLYDKLLISVNKGFDYYITNFFDQNTGVGQGYTYGPRTIPAIPAQYAEAILSFYEYCLFPEGDPLLTKKILQRLPLIVKNMQNFVKKNGSTHSENIIRKLNYDSIRVGNGVVLQALVSYLVLKNKLLR